MVQNCFVAPGVVALNGHAAGQQDAERVGRIPDPIDRMTFFVGAAVAVQLFQQRQKLCFRQTLEQAAVH